MRPSILLCLATFAAPSLPGCGTAPSAAPLAPDAGGKPAAWETVDASFEGCAGG